MIMKTKEWKKKQLANKMSQYCMTANMQDYNNPNLPRYKKGKGRRGNTIPHQPETKRSINRTVKLLLSCTCDGQTADCC